MSIPVAGKFLLEILTKGMYSNAMHVLREYIQNAADAIDKAIAIGLIDISNAEISILIDKKRKTITITDNGIGVSSEIVKIELLSIGDSDKDGIVSRGFRGIGRLGGLAYADQVQFITSSYGENKKTIMTCDCIKMRRLLLKSNKETKDVIETLEAISTFSTDDEDEYSHYFTVKMSGVPDMEEHLGNSQSTSLNLLDEEAVTRYLATTSPVDFNSQSFIQAVKIKSYFEEKGYPIPCYKIYRGARRQPIYKLYSKNLNTGMQVRTKQTDYVRDVELFFQEAADGKPLYIGWLAITDFRGIISDESIQGIRLRKGNILIGNHTTFAGFFPSEGATANKMFAGEIHVLHDDLIPNSQRDDFEPSDIYNELKARLGELAGSFNKKYRRGTSEASNALKSLTKINDEQKQLEHQIASGAITSDVKREKYVEDLERISKRRLTEEKKVRKALDLGTFDAERTQTVITALTRSQTASKKIKTLTKEIINAEYATKRDLPSNYTRDERSLYQRIIAIIDKFFESDPAIAEKLRDTIKMELKEKGK